MKQISIENFLKMTPEVPQYSDRNQNYLIAGANPISYLDDGTQEEQVAPLSASLDWLKINPVVLDSYSETNCDGSIDMNSGFIYCGQSFTNTNATTLSGAKLYLKKTGTPTGQLQANIYTHTGTYGVSSEPGLFLAYSDLFDLSTLTTSLSLAQFIFSGSNRITLSANTYYVIVLAYSYLSSDSSNYISIGVDGSSPTASGNGSTSPNTSVWTVIPQDFIFYVYGGIASGVAIEGNIVHMIPSTYSTYSVYAITNTTKVYGITPTLVTDLGYISGSSASNSGGYLSIGGNTLFATYAIGGSVYKMPLSSGSWTSFGSITTAVGVHIMEPFLDFVALKDGSSSSTNGGLIKKIDVTAFTVSTGIDLGNGYAVIQMRNLNNKYLAIAGGKAIGTADGYPQNYIFLWNGIDSRYNYSIKVPGQFIDMKVIDSILYVAVKVSIKKTCLYYLINNQLRKVLTTQLSTIRGAGYAPTTCSLFDFKNYVGINLTTFSGLTNPVVVYGKDKAGEMEFIHSSGRIFDQFCPGYDGNLFVNEYLSAGQNSNIYYLPISGTYQNILYISQWIPVKNLQSIDIYYDTPPQSGTDAISTTIYGQGEDIITGSSTTVLSDITPSNYLSAKRTRLDVQGFVGDQLKIQLTTTNSTWRPIIRAISLITK